ncbi:MAG: GMC family oxidoreductase [Thermoleophilia bacterium]
MATTLDRTDVVVIGLGAAGGTAVLPLAEAGLKVVGLEPGPRFTVGDFPNDEIRNDIRNWMSRYKVLNEAPSWRPNPDAETGTAPINIMMQNGVGGTSLHYGTQFWRLLPWHFKIRSEVTNRYGADRIPSNSTLIDWPISYEDLEPYYDRVEKMIGVSGQAGNVNGQMIEGGNPFEGARSAEFPLPPLRRTGWLEMQSEVMAGMGYSPFPGPSSIRSEQYEGLPSCQYCGFCTWVGCHVNAKGSTSLNGIPQAEQTGNLEVRTGARVVEIMTDGDGRASGVRYLAGGEEFIQPAGVVVLSTYVYENVRLLLLSKSDAFPNGLANNSGQVGLHYMNHLFVGLNGHYPDHRLGRYNGTVGQHTSMDDFNGDNFDHSDLNFIGGGVISATQEAKPIGTARSTPPGVPNWGTEWKRWLSENGDRVAGLLAQCESLPYEDAFLDLDPERTDPQGFPIVRITWDLHENESLLYDYMAARLEEIHQEAGATETWPSFPKLPSGAHSHAYGGTRMSESADEGVVNGWGIAHEVPNLAILGASTFCTTGGYNPTGTVQATAYRTAEYIVQNFDSM